MIHVLKSEISNLHYDAVSATMSGRVRLAYRHEGDQDVFHANIVTKVRLSAHQDTSAFEEALLTRAVGMVHANNAGIAASSANIFEELRHREYARARRAEASAPSKGLFARLRNGLMPAGSPAQLATA